MSREAARSEAKFFGGRVCLDFANTLNWRLTDAPVELIPDYAAFLAWSENRGTLSKRAVVALRAALDVKEAEATALMESVHDFRADLIEGADILRSGRSLNVGFVNRALSGLPPQPQLAREGERFVFDLDGTDLRQPLWPILWSLTTLLASTDASRIGNCQANGCGWFFVDESPNHSRLWCSDGCGNRERVRRSYAKRRGQPS
ncbi:CGNR zinc finger domain-containing protein [Lichenifustis flavocetrariae]|uniref:CGNR zinc finger domain-containing protein n=1 Tax=Lichenifustis flavocetrariae TaxID=2949735 RepID=A0AA41Z4G5_9HYPH|nr:CGNR zinc finger domain-containing protein [Lichenifustis flavocetrariae]MCW6512907.1 CGNR zinc finger domain-containing protein [Lichenifustis flavocetrariae]